MQETPMITKVHGTKSWSHRDQTKPTTFLKVQTDTPTGQLVLSLSIGAAKELVASLERILKDERFQ
jgi:hypothetical protein